MSSWRDISFEHPYWLLLVLLLPLLWLVYRRYHVQTETSVSITLLDDDRPHNTWRTFLAIWTAWLLPLSILLAMISMARPQMVSVEERREADGIDIYLAMDLSSSMLSRDFDPDRLSVSKDVAIDFVSKRSYDRIGLVSFAGEAFTQSPLTTDHPVIQQSLADLKCGQLLDGTAIGMGLATVVNRLKDSESQSRVVILLTDGVNNAGYIDPATATELATKFNIKVYTIGVGSKGMAMSPVGRTRTGQYQFGRTKVEIDEKLLTDIARRTGGQYYRAVDADALQSIYDEIDQLEKTKIEITVIRRVKEYFRPFLIGSLLSLFVYIIGRYGILKIWPD